MAFNLFSKQKKPEFTDYVKRANINMNEVPTPREIREAKRPLSSIPMNPTRFDSINSETNLTNENVNPTVVPQALPVLEFSNNPSIPKSGIPNKLPELKSPKTSKRRETIIESQPKSTIMSPLYIQLATYEKILASFSYLDNKTSTLSLKTKNITDLKDQYDESLINWINNIEDLQRKIVYIDKTIFERW